MKTERIKTVKKEDPLYPARMKILPNMPETLYYTGNLPDDNRPSAAIVGARMCSGYGHDTAYSLGYSLGQEGIQVISGMAIGIDGYAQQGAVDAGGTTFAVLASGPDVCYPLTNSTLYDQIRLSPGGILSEHEPGTKPLAPYFPSRNRIISALADVVIIVEAKARSGSLITADFALDQGKTVMAVPGRMGDLLSEGCNHLIEQGAVIVCSHETILRELMDVRTAAHRGQKPVKLRQQQKKKKGTAISQEITVPLSAGAYELLKAMPEREETTPDALAPILKLPVRVVSSAFMELVLAGYVIESSRGRFRKTVNV